MKMKRVFLKRMLTFFLCIVTVFTAMDMPITVVAAAQDVEINGEESVSDNDTEIVETTTAETIVEETTEEETLTDGTDIEETAIEATEEIVTEESINVYDLGEGNELPELEAGYETLFLEEFNGSELDTGIWNREQCQPGRTNNELQEYTNLEDNSFVTDGKLILQAIRTKDSEGNNYYTSAKVTTENHFDFTYGKVEASIRVPSGGQGLWPAFWMMPSNEQFYGEWPKCGEIDIMEVLGHEPEKAYQTLHWGNPHDEKQGTMVLENGETFADDYHIFAVEWLPGEFIFSIDGVETHRVTEWYTKTEGGDEATFPAPFDMDFFLQFNLAVGGSWPGNPDSTTIFGEGSQMVIDWVRVSRQSEEAYQAILDELVQPERTVVLRDPDENGNYIVNGDFSVEEALNETDAVSTGVDWVFLTAEGGRGDAFISTEENLIAIETKNEDVSEHGQIYSIQLVQPGIPLKQGSEYTLSFEAKADTARSMIVDITNTSSWSRYLSDTSLDMTTDWNTYEYTFSVTEENDANARLEFNLGKQGSVAPVYLRNITLKQTGTVEVEETVMTTDGNFLRNGGFDVGESRLAYWNVDTGATDTAVGVTNIRDAENNDYVRELKVEGTKGLAAESVTVSQTNIALAADMTYSVKLEAYADEETVIKVKIADVEQPLNLTQEKQLFTFDITTSTAPRSESLVLCVGSETTVYLDNIFIREKALLINGSFDHGMAGWTSYKSSNASALSAEIVKDGSNNVIKYSIYDTGAQNWYIQLKQDNILLEEGKRYKFTFKVRSDITRDILFAFRSQDKTEEDGDTKISYSDTEIATLGGNGETWEEIQMIFEMEEPTDTEAGLYIAMGAVNGKQVSEYHELFFDDFALEETDEENSFEEEDEDAVELIQNGNFAEGNVSWKDNCGVAWVDATAEASYSENGAVFDITDVGTENWHIQLSQAGLHLKQGREYTLKIVAASEVKRYISCTLMNEDSSSGKYYGGKKIKVKASDVTDPSGVKGTAFTVDFTMTMETDPNARLLLSMGKIDDTTTPGRIVIKSVSLKEKPVKEGADAGEEVPEVKEGLRVETIADQTYTGKAIKPAVVVYDGETLLVEKKDYTVKYSSNVKVGTATVKVIGKGNYVGSDTTTFNIVKKDLKDTDITAEDVSVVVKGKTVKDPKVVVKMGEIILKEGRDYVLERPQIQKNKDGSVKTGQYEIKIIAKEDTGNTICNFTGSRTINYDVVPSTAVAMRKVTVTVESISYAGYLAGERPVVSVTSGKGAQKVDLVAKGYCTIKYPGEVTVGNNNVITVTARSGSGFYGTKTVKFTVPKVDISEPENTIKVKSVGNQVYTGKAITPTLYVTVNGIPLTVKKDYTVKYTDNKNVGTATATIKLKGDFKGSVVTGFEITAKPLSDEDITAADVYTVLDKNGNLKFPKVTVKMGKTALKENRDYVVDWSNAVSVNGNSADVSNLAQPGRYVVPIHAAADTEKRNCNFKGNTQIILDVLANGTVMMNKVTAKALSTAYVDYEAYRNDASKVTVTYGKGSNKVDLVAAGLVELAYPDEAVIGKNNVITVTAKEGSGFYGSKQVKFTVTGEKITAKNIKITVSGNNFDYTGQEIRYGENGIDPIVVTKTTIVNVSGNKLEDTTVLTENVDYKLVYKNNVNAGKATVSVVGINAFTGKKDFRFTINRETMNWVEILANVLNNLF